MALPYGVICNDNRHGSGRVTNIDITPDDIEHKNGKVVVYYFDFDECGELKNCKPYLRFLSNMTEEEKAELFQLMGNGTDIQRIDFYLSHHFDFMGLIQKGLAIEVNKENNPYKN